MIIYPIYPKETLEECEVGDFAWYKIDHPERWEPMKKFFIIREEDQPDRSGFLSGPFKPAQIAPEIVVREFEAVKLGIPEKYREVMGQIPHRVRAWRRIK